MCLIALAYRASARYPLVVAANRDESHARPTAAAAWWPDAPDVLGGRDLVAGGTWLAVDRGGRFAAVTNIRDESHSVDSARRSRGLLVNDYLSNAQSAEEFAAAAALAGPRFGPFNMLVLDSHSLCYTSNRAAPRELGTGLHALSNIEHGVAWPKITRATRRLGEVLDEAEPSDALFALLAERGIPRTGREDHRSSLFQLNPSWGTRSSTVVLVDSAGRTRFLERTYDPAGKTTGEVEFEFEVRGSTA